MKTYKEMFLDTLKILYAVKKLGEAIEKSMNKRIAASVILVSLRLNMFLKIFVFIFPLLYSNKIFLSI